MLLSEKKNNWVKNRKVTLRGKPLNYNASQQAKYKKALLVLVNEMINETNKQVKKLFESGTADDFIEQQEEAAAMDASITSNAKKVLKKLSDRFNQLFALKSRPLADKMIDGVTEQSESTLHTSLKQLSGGLSLKTGVVPAGMEDVAQASIAENVSLIKSIPEQYFKDVTGSVMRSITVGKGLKTLVPDLMKYQAETGKRTKRRVELLALDQTRKAYNTINKQRLQKIGVKQFEWVHSNAGQKPRDSHRKISGHIFSFENLEAEQAALGVPEADRGLPGIPINCRCVMNPVIKFDEGG